MERLAGSGSGVQTEPLISLDRLQFQVPLRSELPPLEKYARLQIGGSSKRAGYTEASRGCKHLCRHCPVVPVYQGSFRVVQPEVVLADIRQQVAAGAEHVSFGDPDFFNGPTHAMRIVDALNREWPALSYDATIKIEHLLKHRDLLPRLRETGCLFVTSAVESVDDAVLAKLDKGHTRADFIEVAREFRSAGLTLAPTFIPFTPWTTRESYRELLELLVELDLVEHVAPVQLALRLLIPRGSRLLELDDVQAVTPQFRRTRAVVPLAASRSGSGRAGRASNAHRGIARVPPRDFRLSLEPGERAPAARKAFIDRPAPRFPTWTSRGSAAPSQPKSRSRRSSGSVAQFSLFHIFLICFPFPACHLPACSHLLTRPWMLFLI